MKVLNAAALAFILALASGYALRGFDGLNDKIFVAKLAPPPPKAKLKPETWSVYQAGRLRRLSLYSLGPKHVHVSPQDAQQTRPKLETAPLLAHSDPAIDLSSPRIEATANLDLNWLGQYEHYEPVDFTDKLIGLAQDGPIQRQKRLCAASSKTIKSVGMERQISENTSFGVEYVYKEKCHSQNMAVLTSHDLPNETGVKLRLNMRF